MEQEISAVSEAFSMQPMAWHVGHPYQTQSPLAKIVKESVYDTGDPFDFFIGYDENGKKVFQIRVMCATVQYK